MKKFEERVIPEGLGNSKRKLTTDVICDWCKNRFTTQEWLEQGKDKETLNLTCLKIDYCKKNENGIIEGLTSGWQVEDICSNCNMRLKVLLKENGINVTEVKEHWQVIKE